MSTSLGRVVAVVAGSTMLAVVGSVAVSAPAVAGGRPTNVAFVHAKKNVYIHQAGAAITVRAKLRCKPGWVSSDLSVQVNQDAETGSGDVVTDIPCDNARHVVRLRITDLSGPMHVGPCTISSQFLVNNAESGDSAAGHQANRLAQIVERHPAS